MSPIKFLIFIKTIKINKSLHKCKNFYLKMDRK